MSTIFEIFGKLVNKNAIKSDFGGDLCRSISKIFEKSSFLAKKFIYKFRNFRKFIYRGGVTPPPKKIGLVSLPAFLSPTIASQKASNSILPEDLKDKAYEDQEAAVISYSNKEGISQSNIPTVKHIQRNWDAPLCEIGINSLINESINLTEKARLLAVSAEHSGDWLDAIPIPSLGLKLDNNQLRISCGLRLGTILCHPHK